MPTKTQLIINDVTARIRSGEWPPGTKLPSAREVRDTYGVSQMTVRTAIERLRGAGWVTTAPGAGWWVADSPPQ